MFDFRSFRSKYPKNFVCVSFFDEIIEITINHSNNTFWRTLKTFFFWKNSNNYSFLFMRIINTFPSYFYWLKLNKKRLYKYRFAWFPIFFYLIQLVSNKRIVSQLYRNSTIHPFHTTNFLWQVIQLSYIV